MNAGAPAFRLGRPRCLFGVGRAFMPPQRGASACSMPNRSMTRPTVWSTISSMLAGLLIKARQRRENNPAHLRHRRHVAQVRQVERRFAHHQHQPAALLEHHVGRARDQVVRQAVGHRRPAFSSSRGRRPCRRTGTNRWRSRRRYRGSCAPRGPAPRRRGAACPLPGAGSGPRRRRPPGGSRRRAWRPAAAAAARHTPRRWRR